MAAVSKRLVEHSGLALMGNLGREVRSEHDFRPYEVWEVKVCSFTFTFTSIDQLNACLDYYGQKIHPSSMLPAAQMASADHWELQRWFERLPMYLLEEPKRRKVVQALTSARKKWQGELSERN